MMLNELLLNNAERVRRFDVRLLAHVGHLVVSGNFGDRSGWGKHASDGFSSSQVGPRVQRGS